MKRNFIKLVAIVAMLALVFPALGQNEGKQLSKKDLKRCEKAAKQQAKKLTKDGWHIDGTSLPLETKLTDQYIKLSDDNYREIIGSAGNAKSKNVCQQAALNNAIIKYAQEAKSYIMGRVSSDLGQVANVELDNFYAAYERLISAEIKGELVYSYSLMKRDGGVITEYDSYFLVNETNAVTKRIKAMQIALDENKAAQKYAEKISEYVREGFEVK